MSKASRSKLHAVSLFLAALLCCVATPSLAHAAAIDDVRAAIQGLSADPTSFSADDRGRVEAIALDFDALSDADRITLNAEESHSGTNQPLGRVLEAALWGVYSYNEIDDSTTLEDGVYNASSDPALSSAYSKGKSTSSRQKPWSIKEVQVVDGRATATVTVESDTYSHMWMGGVLYADSAYPDGWNITASSANRKSGYCEFKDVPIDLNSTFYFAGVSTSMPTPIAFSLTTTIREPDLVYYSVSFDDGFGTIISEQSVAEGMAATAPTTPSFDGYTFLGWDTDFSRVTSDLVVTATWRDDSEAMMQNVEDLIDALASVDEMKAALREKYGKEHFSSIEELQGLTNHDAVAKAGNAYNALPDSLKAQIDAKKREKLVQLLIVELPSDPFDVTTSIRSQINAAEAAYSSLPDDLLAKLDEDYPESSARPYSRCLENSVWALESLKFVNNTTSLANGTYTGQVESSSSLGKSKSKRQVPFTIKSITVKNGTVMGILECKSKIYQTVKLGGKEYQNLQTGDGNSYFEVPIALNSTMYFSALSKASTDTTDAVAYKLVVTADESSMTPDKKTSPATDTTDGESKTDKTNDGTKTDKTDDGAKTDDATKNDNKTDDTKGSDNGNTGTGSNTGTGTGNSNTSGSDASGSGINLGTLASGAKTGSTGGSSSTDKAKSNSSSSSSSDASKELKKKDTSTTSRQGGTQAALTAGGDRGGSDDDTTGSNLGSPTLRVHVSYRPAVAGATLLAMSFGVLAFSLWFTRREGVLVQV